MGPKGVVLISVLRAGRLCARCGLVLSGGAAVEGKPHLLKMIAAPAGSSICHEGFAQERAGFSGGLSFYQSGR